MIEVGLGFFVAMAIGITGIGAGTITAPILIYYLGKDPVVAIGTAMLFAAAAKIPAAVYHARLGNIDKAVLKQMVLGGVPGIALGTILLLQFGRDEELKHILLFGVGFLVLITAFINLVLIFKESGIEGMEKLDLIPWFTFLIGLEVGFSSAGAGALGVVLLLVVTRLHASSIVGSDIAFGLILSAIGGFTHLGLGNIDYDLFLKLIGGGIFGAVLGVKLITVIPRRPMKAALLVWLLFIGGAMVAKAAGY